MALDFYQIMATIAGSGLGFIYFSFGRQQGDLPLILSGIALMSYSLFVSSLPWLVLIGATIAFVPFGYKRYS